MSSKPKYVFVRGYVINTPVVNCDENKLIQRMDLENSNVKGAING